MAPCAAAAAVRRRAAAALRSSGALPPLAAWHSSATAAASQPEMFQAPSPAAHARDDGQPTPASHPEQLSSTELTPGVTLVEYAARRAELVGRMPPNSAAVFVAAAPLHYAGTVIPVPTAYRQSSSFLYLTGITQPGCVAVLSRGARETDTHFTLITPPPDPNDATWNGPRLSAAGAAEVFGADTAEDSSRLEALLPSVLARTRGGVLWDGAPDGDDLAGRVHRVIVREAAARGAGAAVVPHAAARLLGAMRWRKSPAEAALLRRSARASSEGILAAAAVARPGALEAAAAAAHEFECRRRGAARPSYPPVAATGPNAATIHYSRLDRRIREGDLFLLDAGCELHGYVSDVTRTWPVSGAFTEAQRELYGSVHEGVSEGATLAELHQLSVALLSRAIVRLGLAPNMSVSAVAKGAYRRFYPHSLGHWIGLDTHDTPTVQLTEPLRAGVALTIEPGLYIPPDADDAPAALRGQGVRIEDDVLVTASGCEVLSGQLPTDVERVEQLAHAGRERFASLAAAAGGGFGGS